MAFQIEVAAITILLSVSLLTLLLTFFLSLFHFQCALYVLGFKNKFMTNSNPVSHLFSNWIFSHSLMIYIWKITDFFWTLMWWHEKNDSKPSLLSHQLAWMCGMNIMASVFKSEQSHTLWILWLAFKSFELTTNKSKPIIYIWHYYPNRAMWVCWIHSLNASTIRSTLTYSYFVPFFIPCLLATICVRRPPESSFLRFILFNSIFLPFQDFYSISELHVF